MGLYSFIKSAVSGVGVGTADLGLEQQMNVVPATIYGPRHNVRRQLVPTAPAFFKWGNKVVPVSVLGNGNIMQGQMVLTPLATEKGE